MNDSSTSVFAKASCIYSLSGSSCRAGAAQQRWVLEQHVCVTSTWHLLMEGHHDEPAAPAAEERPLCHRDSAELQVLHVALTSGREEHVFTWCCVPPAERSALCHPHRGAGLQPLLSQISRVHLCE